MKTHVPVCVSTTSEEEWKLGKLDNGSTYDGFVWDAIFTQDATTRSHYVVLYCLQLHEEMMNVEQKLQRETERKPGNARTFVSEEAKGSWLHEFVFHINKQQQEISTAVLLLILIQMVTSVWLLPLVKHKPQTFSITTLLKKEGLFGGQELKLDPGSSGGNAGSS